MPDVGRDVLPLRTRPSLETASYSLHMMSPVRTSVRSPRAPSSASETAHSPRSRLPAMKAEKAG